MYASFEKLDLNNAYCLPNNLSLEIGGSFESAFFNYIRISLEKCENDTSDEVCQPAEIIDEILT